MKFMSSIIGEKDNVHKRKKRKLTRDDFQIFEENAIQYGFNNQMLLEFIRLIITVAPKGKFRFSAYITLPRTKNSPKSGIYVDSL